MDIKSEWNEPCPGCGALESCCASSKARLETGTSLEALVRRQSATITTIQRELQEARQVIGDLRGVQAAA